MGFASQTTTPSYNPKEPYCQVTIPTDESPYYRQMKNAPEAALQTLEKVYSPELLQSLRDNAEYPDETELADGTPWMQ